MAHRLCQLHSEVHYYYHCFDWVLGNQWNSYCQSHLDILTTKRYGSITSCHTLVRPAYCPFCLARSDFPTPKRLESWTRDRKLWEHISEQHLTECQRPGQCPHPLCDTTLNDYTAFEFHIENYHGLTHPGETVARRALGSNGKVSIDATGSSTFTARKRKSMGGASPLEWMPPQSIPNAGTAHSEPLLCLPSKRPKQDVPTVSPMVLSLDNGTLGPHTTEESTRSPVACPTSPFRTSDDEFALNVVSPEADASHTDGGLADTVGAETPYGDSEIDSLFDQYLRSPTSSPSPVDSTSELSGTTLAESTTPLSSGATDASWRAEENEATGQGRLCNNRDAPRISTAGATAQNHPQP
jgi:hypothetical protein